ncbi:calcyclin-binding protein-like [Montipora foliosa]|uniref:calcyclin-binding protein-like n=1 Tax=Montipora foliosa TaxID=591990 RepID=UPI0035F17790
MERVEDLKEVKEELKSFLSTATRPRVKKLLQDELERVERQISAADKQSSMEVPNETEVEPKKPIARKPQATSTKITSYAWDQSPKFVKIYITLSEVEKLPEENVSSKFTNRSIELRVLGLKGKNYQFQMIHLLHPIVPDSSSVKIKTGKVTILLKKEKEENWSCLTTTENLKMTKQEKKFDESKDPGEGIMDLMRKMYDEGDDEMKRTIAKAWTESREKQNPMETL